MRVSAKTDYAIRAALELAAADDERPVKGERIATAQAIPLRFLENILMQLRHAGLVESRRGAEGGYRLARPASEVTLADVIRAIDGPLAGVQGDRPETLGFTGVAEPMKRRLDRRARVAARRCSSTSRWPMWWAGSCPSTCASCSATRTPGFRTERGLGGERQLRLGREAGEPAARPDSGGWG